MASKLKWTLLSLVGIIVLAVMSMIAGARSDAAAKKEKEPPTASPSR
jgi:hypothetical protein